MKWDPRTKLRFERTVYGPSGAQFTAFDVFEKSGGKCYLCGEVIDPEIRYPHALAYVREDVVAVWQGGAQTLENSRAAHSRCNARKRHSLSAPVGGYSSPSTPTVAYAARLEQPVYDNLRMTSQLLGDSMNQIVNHAVSAYLGSDEISSRAKLAADKQADAIRKLSGKE